MTKLLFGTGNRAKLDHMRMMLTGLDLEIIGLKDLNLTLPAPDESGKSPLENAHIKAVAYYHATRIPTFSCDSGLYFEGLPEDLQPGVHIRPPADIPQNDEGFIAYYSSLAAKYGGKLTAQYQNAICIVLSDERIFEYIGDDTATEPFYLSSTPHEKRHTGFPLDSLSVHIGTGKYYFDLPEDTKKSRQYDGMRRFFERLIANGEFDIGR
ncbi:hypothetical protein FACS1894105_06400 [Clostridia bacterium]|nr:hypothetical protein FACS1894105_06400 [Clostridia bacterium]